MNKDEFKTKLSDDTRETLLKDIYVKDILPKKGMRYLFILESPHTDEINANPKRPLAKHSGEIIYKAVTGITGTPLGEYVLENKTNCKYGIMNICNVPLQQTNQDDDITLKTDYDIELTKILARIREAKTVNYTSEDVKAVHSVINCLFETRLNDALKINNTFKIVLCGKVATKYFNNFNNDKKISSNRIINMPHPSFCDWTKFEEYYKSLKKIK